MLLVPEVSFSDVAVMGYITGGAYRELWQWRRKMKIDQCYQNLVRRDIGASIHSSG